MLQFLDLVLDLLDHRINLLAKVHHLQDIFDQRNRVQHNVEQEGIGPARRQKHDRRTGGEKQDRQNPYVAAADDFGVWFAVEFKVKLFMIFPFGVEGFQTLGPMPETPFVQVRARRNASRPVLIQHIG